MTNSKKPLDQCLTEAERREYYPQLCLLADSIEKVPEPLKALKAVAWIINQRQQSNEVNRSVSDISQSAKAQEG